MDFSKGKVYRLYLCTKDVLCVDCKDRKCIRSGDKGADCPKWKCDNEYTLECNRCAFIDDFIKRMRTS